MAKVIWAADEQNARFLRRRNSLVSLRILLRCTSSNSAILLILAFQSTFATGCYHYSALYVLLRPRDEQKGRCSAMTPGR